MSNQLISRENFHKIYLSKPCDNWKTRMEKILIDQQSSAQLEVPQELIEQAYNEGNGSQKTLLKKYFKISSSSRLDDVEGIEDILMALGKTRYEVVPWKIADTKLKRSQNAGVLIQCITEFCNAGVILDWKNSSQYKWTPYWRRALGGWVLNFVYCCDDGAYLGFGFYYKDQRTAEEAANKFKDIYLDFLPE